MMATLGFFFPNFRFTTPFFLFFLPLCFLDTVQKSNTTPQENRIRFGLHKKVLIVVCIMGGKKKPNNTNPNETQRNEPFDFNCTQVSCYVQWWGEKFDTKLDETKQPFDFPLHRSLKCV
jgi:hypothetical protein